MGAILTLASQTPNSETQVSPVEFLGLVRDFKVMLKLAWRDNHAEPTNLQSFPANPLDLDPVIRLSFVYFCFVYFGLTGTSQTNQNHDFNHDSA